MKKSRSLGGVFLLLCLLLSAATPGVWAVWSYALEAPKPIQTYLSMTLQPFEYRPEEVLPTEGEKGENHLDIITAILDRSVGGLNTNFLSNWFIPNNLSKYGGVLYSRQTVTLLGYPAKNLLEVFESAESGNVYFVIEAVSERELAVYTFSKTAIDSGTEGERVEGYRTVLRKGDTGKWTAEESGKGYIILETIQVGDRDTFLSFDPRNDGGWHWGTAPAQ